MEDDANRRKIGALKLKLQLEQSEANFGNMDIYNKDSNFNDKASHKPKMNTEHSERLHILNTGSDQAEITFNNVIGNQNSNQNETNSKKIKGKKDMMTKHKESVTVSQTANSIAKIVKHINTY